MNDLSLYDPMNDSWQQGESPTIGRNGHTAVWDQGDQMLVFGGTTYTTAGIIYDLSSDSWRYMSTTATPGKRYYHVAVWTGDKMIVWGGKRSNQYLNDGGIYDPVNDTWEPMTDPPAEIVGRADATAVWTGTEMIVWGGYGPGDLDTGGRYNPDTDEWVETSTTGAPDPTREHTAIWTGTEMIIWGGRGTDNSDVGRAYNPKTDTWREISGESDPTSRYRHSAVWTGQAMLIWGGCQGSYCNNYRQDGGLYSPADDTWTTMSMENQPVLRRRHTAVWTGEEMVIWGGYTGDTFNPYTKNGGRYYPPGHCGTRTGTWPNQYSPANSDPWLPQNHSELCKLEPKVMVLNFLNDSTDEEVKDKVRRAGRCLAKGSQYHGYSDAQAPAMLDYEVIKIVDLRDETPPPGYPYRNSTLWPRGEIIETKEGKWRRFRYEDFFTSWFAQYYDITEPPTADPKDLCELLNDGNVQEILLYGTRHDDVPGWADPEAYPYELAELKARYDENRIRIPGEMEPCAGTGCFDGLFLSALPLHCDRTIRIAFMDGDDPACDFMEGQGHGIESTAEREVIPYFTDHFLDFADFNLYQYNVPFSNWYECDRDDDPPCRYVGPVGIGDGDLFYKISEDGQIIFQGTILDYVPACGTAHMPPNARWSWDYNSQNNDREWPSTCEHFRMFDDPYGSDQSEPFSSEKYAVYEAECGAEGGGWQVYWRQSMPGFNNSAWTAPVPQPTEPMLPWWPFLFY